MQTNYYTVTIVVNDRLASYKQVSDLLHDFGDNIHLRVGQPLKEENVAIIFLLVKMSNDQMGTFSGRLGQIGSVKVKSNIIKIEK